MGNYLHAVYLRSDDHLARRWALLCLKLFRQTDHYDARTVEEHEAWQKVQSFALQFAAAAGAATAWGTASVVQEVQRATAGLTRTVDLRERGALWHMADKQRAAAFRTAHGVPLPTFAVVARRAAAGGALCGAFFLLQVLCHCPGLACGNAMLRSPPPPFFFPFFPSFPFLPFSFLFSVFFCFFCFLYFFPVAFVFSVFSRFFPVSFVFSVFSRFFPVSFVFSVFSHFFPVSFVFSVFSRFFPVSFVFSVFSVFSRFFPVSFVFSVFFRFFPVSFVFSVFSVFSVFFVFFWFLLFFSVFFFFFLRSSFFHPPPPSRPQDGVRSLVARFG